MDYLALRGIICQEALVHGGDVVFTPTVEPGGVRIEALLDDISADYVVSSTDTLVQEVLEKMHHDEVDPKDKTAVADCFWELMNTKYIPD